MGTFDGASGYLVNGLDSNLVKGSSYQSYVPFQSDSSVDLNYILMNGNYLVDFSMKAQFELTTEYTWIPQNVLEQIINKIESLGINCYGYTYSNY